MDISVIIVNWKTCQLLEACLDSLQLDVSAQATYTVEILVVDNASMDGSVEMVQQKFPGCQLIANDQNRGFAAANNQAAALAQGKYLLLLNPDTVLHPGLISTLADYLDEHPKVGAVGPLTLNPDSSLQISAQPMPTLFREAWRLSHLDHLYPISQYSENVFNRDNNPAVEVLKGACILLRREALQGETLFDEQFFIYSEEIDLCLRLLKKGWEIRWLPKVSLIHYGGQSTQQIPDQMFLELHRNKIKFFCKHYGKAQAISYKALLGVHAMLRWFFGKLLVYIDSKNAPSWAQKARQYHHLLTCLPNL